MKKHIDGTMFVPEAEMHFRQTTIYLHDYISPKTRQVVWLCIQAVQMECQEILTCVRGYTVGVCLPSWNIPQLLLVYIVTGRVSSGRNQTLQVLWVYRQTSSQLVGLCRIVWTFFVYLKTAILLWIKVLVWRLYICDSGQFKLSTWFVSSEIKWPVMSS